MNAEIENLPVELWYNIFGFMRKKETFKTSSVNKNWKKNSENYFSYCAKILNQSSGLSLLASSLLSKNDDLGLFIVKNNLLFNKLRSCELATMCFDYYSVAKIVLSDSALHNKLDGRSLVILSSSYQELKSLILSTPSLRRKITLEDLDGYPNVFLESEIENRTHYIGNN